jgi:hypothetical protein
MKLERIISSCAGSLFLASQEEHTSVFILSVISVFPVYLVLLAILFPSHYGMLLSGVLSIMKFTSVAALLAVYADSADAISTISTRVGVSTTIVTATSFQGATSTITTVAEITSVATTCAVGSTAPTRQPLSSCTESVWSSSGNY